MSLVYRELNTAAEYEAAVDLEMLVWQMDGRGAVPTHLMQAVAHSGGCVLGAFAAAHLVGLSLAFIARFTPTAAYTLWSHLTAVHPAYQSQGVGYGLKQAQREWALAQGYTQIGWTFDPLQRRNAHFNLRRLGARVVQYHPNFYGEMQDGLNKGSPSDRLQVLWQLDSPRVLASLTNATANLPVTEAPFLVWGDAAGNPHYAVPAAYSAAVYALEVPFDLASLKQHPPRLQAWHSAVRTAFLSAFAAGYVAVDFVTESTRAWYILHPTTL
jgi:predicted GNAT superfamily acetyltransferase